MQHQSQGSAKGLTAGTAGILINDRAISAAEIERHIAAGKRMQAEAIAGFFKRCYRRLRGFGSLPAQGDGHLSRA